MTRRAATRFDSASFAPIAVASRSGFDESLHFGAGVVLDSDGTTLAEIGDARLVVYPRSSLKPLQAEAMVAAGLETTPEILAVACASHSGEEHHLEVVRAALASFGATEHDLQNTSARPYGTAARHAARLAAVEPSPLQQNCSGKHAAMLATCQVNAWSTETYLDADHPLQQAIVAGVSELAGEHVAVVGVDGCGAPTHAISLRGLARAFAQLARDSAVAPAMRQHPDLVGGTDRDVTIWMQAVPGLITKDGAAGVMAGALPDGRSFAYKISDGSDAARQAVMSEALRCAGVASASIADAQARTVVDVLGHGRPVGRLVGLEWQR